MSAAALRAPLPSLTLPRPDAHRRNAATPALPSDEGPVKQTGEEHTAHPPRVVFTLIHNAQNTRRKIAECRPGREEGRHFCLFKYYYICGRHYT